MFTSFAEKSVITSNLWTVDFQLEDMTASNNIICCMFSWVRNKWCLPNMGKQNSSAIPHYLYQAKEKQLFPRL